MPTAQKLRCVVEQIAIHDDRVYSVVLRPDRPAPRFLPGQFLHLALDPYEPGGFWPESRVFSIASSPASRERLEITYAVHGAFTSRMERELTAGATVWIKAPYGEFIIDPRHQAVLIAGGTGMTAFTAFVEALGERSLPVVLAYGARAVPLLVYRDLVARAAARASSFRPVLFAEVGGARESGVRPGRIALDAVWDLIPQPGAAHYYIAGPPAMIDVVRADLRSRDIAMEAIHVDAWE